MGSGRKLVAWQLLPGAILLAAVAFLLHVSKLSDTAAPVLDFYPWFVLAAALIVGARFRSNRVVFAAVVLTVAAWGIGIPVGRAPAIGVVVFDAVAFLLPLNLLAASLSGDGAAFFTTDNAFRSAIVALQAGIVALLCRPELAGVAAFLRRPFISFHFTRLPQTALVAFAVTGSVLLLRLLLKRRPVDTAFAWALVAAYLGLAVAPSARAAGAYLATGGLALVASLIETSYRMAYLDELTGLPGRRAFNEASQRLGDIFAVAIVDIDHFKSFNDTYGHDVGDQVLRMVASQLARVTGGGEAYRCGGEEFAILYPQASAEQALPHLEELRERIETSTFNLRTMERRKERRDGNDRRTPTRTRKRVRGGAAHVTVSIGVAEPSARRWKIEDVVRAADQALYRAKGAGRNRVELASDRKEANVESRMVPARRPSSS